MTEGKGYLDPDVLIDGAPDYQKQRIKRGTSINSNEVDKLMAKADDGYDAKKYAHVNFNKALLCSVCFLGMYIALYSAQNVQSVLF